ncbi:MAG: protein kinase, partial [Calditrichaeota bacterium]|nr:protein kinase [Calditrichota bacterium]
MIGKLILHYKIIEKLGQGGMGVVYLAEDTKLERQVAIKFLPQHISANSDERKRFEIEAKAAAALNHPNIATIFAIEEANNEMFLVMEYIDGKELKDIVRVKHSSEKALTDTSILMNNASPVQIATQIAEGLQAAHEKGIIHRDIKSSNIMVTDKGKVKIMDFGLAKFRDSRQLTRVGTTIGTAAYMSPEQARGEEADPRSDIWSFGIILYELLSGEMPFKGAYEAAIMFSIINDPADMQLLKKPDISENFISIVSKCLEKDKEQRYQSMDQDINNLNSMYTSSSQISRVISEPQPVLDDKSKSKSALPKWIFAVSGVIVIIAGLFFLFKKKKKKTTDSVKMLAVLPFQNLGNTEDEYFADGITGEIISNLSALSNLRVIARSTAMQYKNSQKTLKQIAEELGVQFVLEGTIQWENTENGRKRIRVNPELIKIENSTQIWSSPYEADFSSAFTLQADIAGKVASALNLKLVNSEQQALQKTITNSSEAYDLYLKAIYYAQDISNEKNHRIAEDMLGKAIALDNQFAHAFALLSTVQSNLYWSYFDRSDAILNKSKSNAQKALAINSNLPEAHTAMGDFFYHGLLDYEKALQEYDQALKISPNHLNAISGIAYVARRQGDMRKTIDYLMKAYALNPKDYDTVFSIGETYCLLRDYNQAISYLEKVNIISPEAIHPYFSIGLSYLLKTGDVEKCRDVINAARTNKIGLDSHLYINVLY